MINERITNLLNNRKNDNINNILGDLIKLYKCLSERLEKFFIINDIDDINPNIIFEAFFCRIIISLNKFDDNISKKYEYLCKILSIKITFTDYLGIMSLRSEECIHKPSLVLSQTGVKFFSQINDNNLIENLEKFLVLFVIFIGDFSAKVINILDKILYRTEYECESKNNLSNNYSKIYTTSFATSMNGSLNIKYDDFIKLEIIELGGTIINKKNEDYISIGLIIKNHNKTMIAKNINIIVKLYNNVSFIVEKFQYHINNIFPNSKFGFGCEIYCLAQRITKYEVSLECNKYEVINLDILKSIKYKFEYVSSLNKYNSIIKYNLIINGLKNNLMNCFYSYIVFRNENGKIIGGGCSNISETSYEKYNLVVFNCNSSIYTNDREVYLDLDV